ncbi:hypothetical protein AB8O38_10745 [Saccharomonospora xinjiangensis]|uniref:hypothetical protein n=1 Tax=Saccharomonospora xinjiangensis TaxID=75294 RepID=UPI003510BBD7
MTDIGRAVRDADRVRVSLITPQASVTDIGRAVRDADRVGPTLRHASSAGVGRVSLITPQASMTDIGRAVRDADRDARERHWRLR